MTRKDFEALPYRERWDKPVEFRSFVILPSKRIHDSGYRMMDYIACNSKEPMCRLSGASDVLHILSSKIISIECLPKSGLLHVFIRSGGKFQASDDLSSFDIRLL